MKLTELVGKRVKIFTKNGFVHGGKVISLEDNFMQIEDEVKKKPVLIHVTHISEFEILENI